MKGIHCDAHHIVGRLEHKYFSVCLSTCLRDVDVISKTLIQCFYFFIFSYFIDILTNKNGKQT